MPLPRKAWQALKDVQRALETGQPIETEDFAALVLALERITELGASPDDEFGFRRFDHNPIDRKLHADQWRIACAIHRARDSGAPTVAEAKQRARRGLRKRFTSAEIDRAWKIYGGKVRRLAKAGRNPSKLTHIVRDDGLILDHKPRRLFLT